jgi:hypothetical protein
MFIIFYSKGLDAFRYIVNDEYGDRAPLYPAKIYPHSDEVDFQMGEVEWKGGNVYYTKWGSSMKVDYISPCIQPCRYLQIGLSRAKPRTIFHE